MPNQEMTVLQIQVTFISNVHASKNVDWEQGLWPIHFVFQLIFGQEGNICSNETEPTAFLKANSCEYLLYTKITLFIRIFHFYKGENRKE